MEHHALKTITVPLNIVTKILGTAHLLAKSIKETETLLMAVIVNKTLNAHLISAQIKNVKQCKAKLK